MDTAIAPPAPVVPIRRAPSDRSPSDRELIRRVSSGDAGAFELLYRRYVRAVYALALRRLGDRDRAEDAVQETFTSVWRSARSYRPDRGEAAAWLYAIARNAVVDRLRGRSAENTDEPPELPSTELGPAERAEAGWVAWRVHRAVETLPDAEREVVELAYWRGLSQTEIAARLGIPLGTVKTRTRSALAHLAELLDGEGLR